MARMRDSYTVVLVAAVVLWLLTFAVAMDVAEESGPQWVTIVCLWPVPLFFLVLTAHLVAGRVGSANQLERKIERERREQRLIQLRRTFEYERARTRQLREQYLDSEVP